jgi:hypothetical protein
MHLVRFHVRDGRLQPTALPNIVHYGNPQNVYYTIPVQMRSSAFLWGSEGKLCWHLLTGGLV